MREVGRDQGDEKKAREGPDSQVAGEHQPLDAAATDRARMHVVVGDDGEHAEDEEKVKASDSLGVRPGGSSAGWK